MITTIIFAVSLFAICFMIAFKAFQLKFQTDNFLSAMAHKADLVLHGWIELGVQKYFLYRKIAHLFLFDFLPRYAYNVLNRMKDYIATKYYIAGDQFRGRRVLRGNGSVSFFLQELADESREMKGEKV